MASTYLQRTPTTRTNNQKFTYSCWFKRSELGTSQYFVINLESGNDRGYVAFDTDDKMFIFDKAGGTDRFQATSNFVLRDTSAWYHLVYSVDSTAGSNRVKIYINGVDKYSDFTVATAMSQNSTVGFQQGTVSNSFKVGSQEAGNTTFNGLMSYINFVDGLQLDASAFGETDSTTGEWKILTSPTVSEYGNNGFFILKNGNSLTDQSGKGNNLTLGAGTLTKTEDCPSDVFATLNSLDSDLTSNPFQYGNTKVSGQNPESAKYYCGLTLGMMGNGKYYFEGQLNVNNQGILGVCNLDASDNPTYLRQQNTFPGRYSSSWGYDFTDGYKFNNNNKTAYGSGTSWTTNDYFSFALDNTNGKMYIAKNGSWVSGGDPTNGTGGIDYSAIGDNNMFIVADNNSAGYNKFTFNFGNGSFDTTTLSTTYSPTVGNTGAKFKYNIIPTGFTALSTKGLNA